MTSSKHAKGDSGHRDADRGLMSDTPRPPGDLERDPGIGTSKGVFGRGTEPMVLRAENTEEGDVMNDTTPQGGIDSGQQGRTNK